MKRPSILSRLSIYFLFGFSFLVLSSIGLMWSCATLKQKFSKKQSQTMSLSYQQILNEHSAAMERKERELISHFGESVTLMLKDGFRFHQDSGLMGNGALLHYQTQRSITEKQNDSTNLAYLSELYSHEDAQLKTIEIEKRKTKPVSNWWLLLLIPVFWFVISYYKS